MDKSCDRWYGAAREVLDFDGAERWTYGLVLAGDDENMAVIPVRRKVTGILMFDECPEGGSEE